MAATVSESPSPTKIASGKGLYQTCVGCHGETGGGNEGDGYVPYGSQLPRSESVTGVIDQLVEDTLGKGVMPEYDGNYTFAEKEAIGDYICVEFTKKCHEGTG